MKNRYRFVLYSIISLAFASSLYGVGKAFKLPPENYTSFTFRDAFNSIEEEPIASFDYAQSESCADSPIQFTDTSIGEGLTYFWDFGDGETSDEQNPVHSFSTAVGSGTQVFDVRLTVTNEEGEIDTIEKEIEVNQIPSLDIGSDRGRVTFDGKPYFTMCSNADTEFVFYNQSTSISTNLSYTIDWGDGSDPFEATSWTELAHTFPVGTTTVNYTIEGPTCTVTETYYVFVGSDPSVGLSRLGSDGAICVGDTLSFKILNENQNPPGTIYRVTFSDGSVPQEFEDLPPEGTIVSHVFDRSSCGLSNDSFSYTIQAINPCKSSSPITSSVTVLEVPEPIINLPEDPFCVDTPVSIRNRSNYGNQSSSFNCEGEGKFYWEISPATGWTLPNGSLGIVPVPENSNTWVSGSRNIEPTFTEPGTYYVTLTNGTSSCGIKSKTDTICVLPKPIPSFEVDKVEACGPVSVKATNTSNILEACDTKLFNWSVSYNRGDCGTGADWEFAEGSDNLSENPEFVFTTPGEYTISLNYQLSCGTFRDEKTILVNEPPEVEILGLTDLCGPGALTPTSNVISCGSSETTYEWSFEGGTPATFEGEIPGEVYFESLGKKEIRLKVTNSCDFTEVIDTVEVYDLPEISFSPLPDICLGESVLLSPEVIPDDGNYTYSWSSIPNSTIPNASAKEVTVSPTQHTIYKLRVTNEDSNCFVEEEVELTVTPVPQIEFSIPDQTICSGELSLPVALSLGESESEISWEAMSPTIAGLETMGSDNIPAQTLINPTSQAIDIQFVASINASELGNCNFVPAVYTITVLPTPVISDQTLEICNGEEAVFTAPWPETLFKWSVIDANGAEESESSEAEFRPFIQSPRNPGNTPVTVTYELTPKIGDCEGAPFTTTVTILPSPNVNFSIPDQVICTGLESQEVVLSSDVPGVSFTWLAESNGAEGLVNSGEGNTIPTQSLINPTDAPIDVEYKVFVKTTEGTSCEGTPTIYTITINPEIQLEETISDYNIFNISCAGSADGAITISPTGGSGQYSINWSGPEGFQSSSTEITNLIAGTYELSIEDEYGCIRYKNYVLTQPEPLNAILIDKMDISCKGEASGSIEIEANGGVENQGYSFFWTRNGEEIPNTTSAISNLLAGNYAVTVTDANNCSFNVENILLTEPDEVLSLSIDKGDISCYNANDGYINMTVQGGVLPYQINWDFGSSETSFDNMGPGTYTVTVEDGIGCIRIAPVTIEDAPLFDVDPEVSQISCSDANDGSIRLNLEGQDGDISIRWDHGPEVENLFNLGEGRYSVTLTNADGCSIRKEFNIINPAPLGLEPTISDALDCNDPQSGSIILNVSGGRPPYKYNWSNGQTTKDLINITNGSYAVTVTDSSGCVKEGLYEVRRPLPLEITGIEKVIVECEPRKITTEVSILISGGTPEYEIIWSGGDISEDRLKMTTTQFGFYNVQVTDENGCSTNWSINIENSEILVDMEPVSATFQQDDGFMVNRPIEFRNTSVGSPETFYWDFGDGNNSMEASPVHLYQVPGTYSITLTAIDKWGCETSDTFQIEITDYFLKTPNVFTPNGDNLNQYFMPQFSGIENIVLTIMNKWGEIIFHTEDLHDKGWDGMYLGKKASPGNYVYKLNYTTADGRNFRETGALLLLE